MVVDSKEAIYEVVAERAHEATERYRETIRELGDRLAENILNRGGACEIDEGFAAVCGLLELTETQNSIKNSANHIARSPLGTLAIFSEGMQLERVGLLTETPLSLRLKYAYHSETIEARELTVDANFSLSVVRENTNAWLRKFNLMQETPRPVRLWTLGYELAPKEPYGSPNVWRIHSIGQAFVNLQQDDEIGYMMMSRFYDELVKRGTPPSSP